MAATARLASRAYPLCRPNPGVAAIIVKDGRVISRGFTQPGGRPHAEAIALEGLSNHPATKPATNPATGTTMYVTLEPCAHRSERGPACAQLVASAKPGKVVVGQLDPDPRTNGDGIAHLRAAGIEVVVLGDNASRASLKGFLTRQSLGRPYVTLKLATSLDGQIAMADGTSQWITGEEARAHVHAQRARQDVICVGGGTWRADKPRLDVRLAGLEGRSPERVLLSRGIAPDGVRVINEPAHINTLDGVHTLYVEGGAEAAASFLASDLVDEIHLYRAPIVIGRGKSALGDIGLQALGDAHGRWSLDETRQLGSDTFTSYVRSRD